VRAAPRRRWIGGLLIWACSRAAVVSEQRDFVWGLIASIISQPGGLIIVDQYRRLPRSAHPFSIIAPIILGLRIGAYTSAPFEFDGLLLVFGVVGIS